MSLTPLKRVAKITYGLGQPPRTSETGVPIIRATNINHGTITPTSMLHANVADLPLDRAPLLKAGEILVVRSGAYTGDSALVTPKWAGCSPGYDLRVTPCGAESRFLAYCMLSSHVLEQISIVSSRAAQPHLNAEELGELRIFAPTLDEQRRIADFLDAETARIDELVRLRNNHVALLREHLSTTLQKMATTGGVQNVRETGNRWIPVVAEGWLVLPLKRRWSVIDCKHRTPTYVESGYPVVSPGDISPGRLDLTQCTRFVDAADYRDLAAEGRQLRRGDIVYSRNASVGIAAYVDTDAPFTMGQDVCKISSESQSQLFLTYFLNCVAANEIESLQIGSTFSRVNISMLLNLSVTCPPPDTQVKLANRMDSISEEGGEIESVLQRQLIVLQERRQALITAAVTGQFDVTTGRGADLS